MEDKKPKTAYGNIYAQWQVEEFDKHERSKNWYIAAITVAFVLMLFAFLTGNFLFAVIIIIASLIIILHDGQTPDQVRFFIADDGVNIGRRFYEWDEIKNFSIVYKPRQKIKKLYFEFKSFLIHRLSVDLHDQDPVSIRKHLVQYLPEDTERTDLPLSEVLAKIFKI